MPLIRAFVAALLVIESNFARLFVSGRHMPAVAEELSSRAIVHPTTHAVVLYAITYSFDQTPFVLNLTRFSRCIIYRCLLLNGCYLVDPFDSYNLELLL